MPAGRPPTYKTLKELQDKIDEYFNSRKAPLLDKKDIPVLDENEDPIMVDIKPYTVTGLALALGFTSRQALLNYQAKEEFVDAITRAKFKCQEYAESRLFDKDGARGAQFTLQNNFGWVDESKVDTTIRNPEGESFRIDSVADADKIIAEYEAKRK